MVRKLGEALDDEWSHNGTDLLTVISQDWGEKVVVSRNGLLITGQNPASATGVGKAIYDAIFGELTTKDEI
jgi:putative intracellular protease/amidase